MSDSIEDLAQDIRKLPRESREYVKAEITKVAFDRAIEIGRGLEARIAKLEAVLVAAKDYLQHGTAPNFERLDRAIKDVEAP